ncbi:MAG: transporter substrate-binding domain-containing protein [Burkholderiaceae bacterium]
MPSRRTFLLATGGVLAPLAAIGKPRELVIAAGELPPYSSARREESFLGALFEQIAPLMDARFEFRYLPWRRCEIAVDEQVAWGAVPYVPNAERELKHRFSAPLYAKQTRLFYYSAPGRPPPAGTGALDQLRGYRIGGVRGYFYEQLLRDAGIQMEEAIGEDQNFRKLQAGRVDLVAAVDAVGMAVIRRLFPPGEVANFGMMAVPLHVGFNHLMTSMRYPETVQLLGQFDAALTTLRQNGAHKRLCDAFGVAGF